MTSYRAKTLAAAQPEAVFFLEAESLALVCTERLCKEKKSLAMLMLEQVWAQSRRPGLKFSLVANKSTFR